VTVSLTRSRLCADVPTDPHDELLDIALPLREFNALARSGFEYVDDLEDLVQAGGHVPGVGVMGWENIHAELTAFRARRNEPLPPPRADHLQQPKTPGAAMRVEGPSRAQLTWTALEEQRLIDEIRSASPNQFPAAIRRAAERRGVIVPSVSGTFHELTNTANTEECAFWTHAWRVAAYATNSMPQATSSRTHSRHEPSAAAAHQQKSTSAITPDEREPPSRHDRSNDPPKLQDNLSQLTFPDLVQLDQRIRAETYRRVTGLHSAVAEIS